MFDRAEEALVRFLRAFPQPDAAWRAIPWDALLAAATRHGVDGLLLARVRDERPDAERELAFRRILQTAVSRSLDESLAALDAASIRCAPLKGPTLAHRLYPEPSLRRSTDVDVLIRPDDVERAVAALGERGYRLTTPLPPPEERSSRRSRRHTADLRKGDGPLIEVHYRAFVGFGTELPAGPLLDRARDEAGVRVLAPEDELLYLAVHAAGHAFARLGWLLDVRLLLERNPAIDGAVVRARAREHRLTTALAIASAVLETTLGVPIPGAPRAQSVRTRTARRLLARAWRFDESSRAGKLLRRAYRAIVSERLTCVRDGC